ncbi:mechanosensitive ion channel family protein [Haloarchaeobius amylolyticus]|uniref:Mechanosensitive ion channel family protein n=1 Tax=Haloarchaeobius amylolyticus TaxID=1198296 RepID=A0ABD6BG08_9EURY
MVVWQSLLNEPAVIAAAVLALGLVVGYLVGRLNEELLSASGVPNAVEGTPFERTAQSLGTSTVEIVARLSSWFIYGIAVLTAIHIAQLLDTNAFWLRITEFIPQLFIAVLVLIVGFVVADKSELVVSEYLRGVKLPEVSVIPKLVKYSVLYVTFIIALGQIGVHVLALLILLTVYAVGVVIVGTVAFKDFLVSSAAGIYLLLNQPYGIGDEIKIGEQTGIVQEVDLFVTKIEDDSEEYIVPNRKVFENGIVRMRK